MENKKKRSIFSGKFIYLIQLIMTALTVYAFLTFDVLPTKYLMIGGGVLLFSLLITVSILKYKPGKSKAFTKILSLLISIGLGFTTYGAMNGKGFVDSITGAESDTHVVSIIVMKDSGKTKVSEVKNEVFGVSSLFSQEAIEKTKELVSKKFKISIEEKILGNPVELAEALYEGDVKVILLSESHRHFITDYIEDFDDKTTVIGSVSYEVKTDLTNYDTDVKNDTFSIFLSGIDTYGPVSTASRSDVNLIMTINPVTNQILLTSIPRDYHVVLATSGKKDKLTHAGNFGATESVKTLENLLNIEIDYYAKVNFSSVTKIVDALGGVSVETKYNFTGPNGHSFTKGSNHVNGEQALSFVRERYSLPNGDSDRGVHQQALVTGILNKAMSPSIITNMNSVLSAIEGSFEMSMPSKDFKDLIKTQADSMKSWEILNFQLTGTGAKSTTTYSMPGWNLYVMEPNTTSVDTAKRLILAMENNEVIAIP